MRRRALFVAGVAVLCKAKQFVRDPSLASNPSNGEHLLQALRCRGALENNGNILDSRGGNSESKRFSFREFFPFQRIVPIYNPTFVRGVQPYDPLRMYVSCLAIVIVWIATGTVFYSLCNGWPLPQSFFYAVDAGMSIGFCTQVFETKLISKAFTILFILLGASVVGGALALFMQDALEGLVTPAIEEYQVLLERDVFDRADLDRTGELTFEQFQALILSSLKDEVISEEDIRLLWKRFNRLHDEVIHFEEFAGSFRGIEGLIQMIRHQQTDKSPMRRMQIRLQHLWRQAWHLEHRIYTAFCLWVAMGILWGMIDQRWDAITATHFAVSALATGGLTAPDVNADGILPAEPSIFCGLFCLFGIPLFALTLGHFAKVLVSGHVAALDRAGLTRPMSRSDYEVAAHLTTNDSVVHLSDFIVLQLLRQGKLTKGAIYALKQNFELLDTDHSGKLTLEQATATIIPAQQEPSLDSTDTPGKQD